MTFRFNNDYNDLEQVRPWLAEFTSIHSEIVAAGKYPYNDSFKNRIPGIANTEKRGPSQGTHEEAAIYLLQKLYRAEQVKLRVDTAIADGCEPISTVPETTKFSHVIVYDDEQGMRGPDWQEWDDARLVGHDGGIYAVLPKGKRRYGTLINGRKVLVRK